MKLDRQLWTFLLVVLHYRVTSQTSVITAEDGQYCTTDTGDHGLCVYQYQCLDGRIIYDGETLIDLRRAGDDCGEYILVCCNGEHSSENVPTTVVANETVTHEPSRGRDENATARPPVATTTESSVHESQERTSDKPEKPTNNGKTENTTVTPPAVSTQRTPIITGTSTTKRPLQPPPLNIPEYIEKGCGHRNPNGVVFSIENNVHSESEYGEYPWVAAIFVRDETTSQLQYRCGGALIDQAAVLTTASCLYLYRSKPSQLVVRLGEWDMSMQREPLPHVDSEAENVHIHPDYGVSSKVNDIAVVILRETMVLNHIIGVVCLPQKEQEVPNTDLIGAGWGDAPSFVIPKKYPQSILKKAHLKSISNGECQNKMRKLMSRRFQLHQSFICAEAIDTEMLPCRGDSGSPYVVEVSGGSDRYYLVGLSSWGYDCNRQNTPTVMTNVAYHRDWIDKVVKKENLNPWSYTYEPEENIEDE
ncbi:AGAP011791-PA-like protein [Anopheles sinensis]|uniref:AGAP011791-PA-like protein n=1 Tax=Anopheles sinensis TaxID=74873 RepID=A0A084WHQ5_ANOSI|nr:AGAP011791-PA-like protein [Anopheles sinensis]